MSFEEADRRRSNRISFLVLMVFFWFLAIIGRLFFLQVLQHREFARCASEQQQGVLEISSKRGIICDRGLQELTINVDVSSVYANPQELESLQGAAASLARALNLDEQELIDRLALRQRKEKSFAWIKRKITPGEETRVRALEMPGVYFVKEAKRSYPNNHLAAHVLGFVGVDNQGLYGLEFFCNEELTGQPGQIRIERDAKRNSFSTKTVRPSMSGKTLVLSISKGMQYIVENALDDVIATSRPAAATIIVMDPHTGEVLAMGSRPTFDPNHYDEYPVEARRVHAITDVYEPGSTFKVIVAAGALEENLTKPTELIDCQWGVISVRGHIFHDHKRFGVLDVTDIIAKSSDVGAIKLGLKLGEKRLYRYIDDFGFGKKTGIDLPGEIPGLLRKVEDWSAISIGAISFGQEIGVTPLQMLQAVCVIANGGYLVKPYVVDRILSPSGQLLSARQPERKRVLSEETAAIVRNMMTAVVERGTAKTAALDGYSAAGKTGTAQKVIDGRYSRTKYVASFVGFAPAENPAVAVIVVVDAPKGRHHGGEVAAPVFRDVVQRILVLLGVPQTREPQPPERNQLVALKASARGVAAVPAVDSDLQDLDTSAPDSAPVVATGSSGGAVAVPDFRGKSLRAVAEECAMLGLDLKSTGAGVAVQQAPAAGAMVFPGAVCDVWFAGAEPKASKPPTAKKRIG
jgi:cell division protein FtsI (penicillin-binding protein 3)